MKIFFAHPRDFFSRLIGGLAIFIGSPAVANVPFEHSIVPVENAAAGQSASAARSYGRIVRTALTAHELSAVMQFNLTLKLQNQDELNARISQGEVLSPTALEAYLPSQEDYAKIRAWLVANGFKVTLDSNTRHAIFAEGTNSQIAAVFGVSLARVATADGEFTSAISAPLLPDDLAAKISGVRGLQPHLIRHPRSQRGAQAQLTATGYHAITPAAVATAYQTPASLTGSGNGVR